MKVWLRGKSCSIETAHNLTLTLKTMDDRLLAEVALYNSRDPHLISMYGENGRVFDALAFGVAEPFTGGLMRYLREWRRGRGTYVAKTAVVGVRG